VVDLWGQAWFLDRGARLGKTFGAFTDRWFKTHPSGFGLEVLPHAFEQVTEQLQDICLSIEAKDYLDLPPQINNTIAVDMPPKAMRIYRDLERNFFTEIAGHEIEAFNAAAKSVKCLQLASGAIYTNGSEWQEVHSAKLEALESVIEEAAGMPVLVAYHFKSDLARILKAFPKARHLDANPQTLRDWNAGKIPLLLAHPASAGHGLNMQDGGNILAFFSHWWNLEEYQQIIERIGPTRQAQAGHNRPVYVHHIVARGTLDESVMDRRETKKSLQELFMERMKRAA
jgi:SNF2 family DNA or RNA helicase